MSFSESVIEEAWQRQSGKCAHCCKELIQWNHDVGVTGAWHAHHRKPTHLLGTDTITNCVILCINEPENCHFNYGHGGISWEHYAPLSDEDMPCFRSQLYKWNP